MFHSTLPYSLGFSYSPTCSFAASNDNLNTQQPSANQSFGLREMNFNYVHGKTRIQLYIIGVKFTRITEIFTNTRFNYQFIHH